ncbi:MAG: amidohydrolase [Acidisphaera sp.]|nr:amidohydrolase [Acidisphaera sp.]
MNVELRERPQAAATPLSRLAIADCDIHPTRRLLADIHPYLSKRWQEHLQTFGLRYRQPYQNGPAYPKGQPQACRRDAVPPGGGKPGCDLDFMRAQHLDPNNVQLGILNPLSPSGQGFQNTDFSIAFCRAINDWQVAEWTSREKRLRASIVVPYEDGAASAAEIDRCAGDPQLAPHFAQVLLLSRTAEPLGNRRYWPIYEAALRAGLPVGVHAFGYGGSPITAGGWPSYYIEEMVGHAQCSQALLTSMVIEGVFEKFPALRVVLIESGFAWLPSLLWRMDKHWARLRQETPHLRRLPSEYVRDQVWLTTQPMEEPADPAQLRQAIEWIGWDRLLFATDYPHWDFDDPSRVLPLQVAEAQRRAFFLDNARTVYGTH